MRVKTVINIVQYFLKKYSWAVSRVHPRSVVLKLCAVERTLLLVLRCIANIFEFPK